MGFLFKTVVAGIIAASLAGGVIYFGLAPTNTNGSVSLGSSSSSTAPSRNNGNFIDRAIKPINDYMKARKSNQPSGKQPNLPQASMEDEIKYYRLEDGEFTEVDRLPMSVGAKDTVNPNASLRILAVMEQAELIKQPDLRDRAYLDVVDFAVINGLFTPANKAMALINQVELRDTARSRMAMALARSGDSDGAFKLIDGVEVNELRDIMRLQVIEALIALEPPASAQQ